MQVLKLVRFANTFYQNGSGRSPKRSHQRSTISVWQSSLRTDRWHCYGVPSRALISKRLVSSIKDTLERQGKLPSFYHRYVDDSDYFPAYPQQCPYFVQIHHGGGKERQASFPWHRTTQPCTSDWNQGLCETNKHGFTITLPKQCRQSLQTKLTDNYAWSCTPMLSVRPGSRRSSGGYSLGNRRLYSCIFH